MEAQEGQEINSRADIGEYFSSPGIMKTAFNRVLVLPDDAYLNHHVWPPGCRAPRMPAGDQEQKEDFMSYKTLGQMIADKDYQGRTPREAGWHLDAEIMEDLLYDRQPGYFSTQEAHENGFREAEKIQVVELNSWTCTDTQVGLDLILLNGEPVILGWQTARKNPASYAFVSEEAFGLVRDAWERHRPSPDASSKVIAGDRLSMPVAAADAEPFEIDSEDVFALSLSAVGVARWIKAIGGESGLDQVTDRAVLENVLAASQRQEASNAKLLEDLDRHLDGDDPVVRDIRKEKEAIQKGLIEPLTERLEGMVAETLPAP